VKNAKQNRCVWAVKMTSRVNGAQEPSSFFSNERCPDGYGRGLEVSLFFFERQLGVCAVVLGFPLFLRAEMKLLGNGPSAYQVAFFG
jgi:hypothetical protein